MKDYYWLNKESRTFLERGYLKKGVTPEDRIKEIATAAEQILNIHGFADKFEDYMKKGWISLASPVWSNFGAGRGLPISCNGSYMPDTIEGMSSKIAEIATMSKHGAGTSAYFGDVRPRGSAISVGGASSGSVHFMRWFDETTDIISQSNVRRGQFAAYLPIDHGDIEEFLQIRSEGHKIQHTSIGVTISDKWMKEMEEGDKEKRKLWGKVLKKRTETGYPYIFWSDTVNNSAPKVYKDKGLTIHASNLCTEIALHSNEDESFVCNLSSLNLLHWDDWKETDLVETVIFFLDAVMSEYINKTAGMKHMEPAHNFALKQRALGLGVLGWHSYLQSKMIPFESMEAKLDNVQIFKHINEKSLEASRELAKLLGEPELLKGYGLRNVTRLAIAPTKSSSFILGQVSPSTEPLNDNYFIDDQAKGKFTYRNPFLKKLLEKYDKDDVATWKNILSKGGSVQHLDFLTTEEKDVFKTFGEISQKEVLIQAAQRQKYIDQAQSINLKIHPDTPLKELNQLYLEAWRLGIKTLYYQKGTNPAQELGRSILSCVSCEA